MEVMLNGQLTDYGYVWLKEQLGVFGNSIQQLYERPQPQYESFVPLTITQEQFIAAFREAYQGSDTIGRLAASRVSCREM